MFNECYLYETKLSVRQLINRIKYYPEHEVCLFEDNGIVLDIDKEHSKVYIEHYYNVFDIGYFEMFDTVNDYLNLLSKSIIYYHIKVKDLIDILKPFEDYQIEVSGEETCFIYIGDNTINLEYLGCVNSDYLIADMVDNDEAELFRVI